MTTNLTSLKTCHGSLVAFNCTAQGNPEASIALYQDNVMLSEVSEGFWIEALTTVGDLGFSCIANNSAGTEVHNSTVTVNGELKKMHGFVFIETLELFFKCSCTDRKYKTLNC